MQETDNYERKLESLVRERTKELENIQEHLLELTHKDSLTNLYNRRYANEVMDTLIHIGHREKTPISLLMIDIDKFKNINDAYGHLNGDIVLKKLAKILMAKTRKSDVVMRFGGEEFLILLSNTALSGALEVAKTIQKTIEETVMFLEQGKSVCVTASIGVVSCDCVDYKDKNELIESADKAMYKAKREGRNRVFVYDN
ncbi:GGDEF domain-containing protein [Sulfurimonas sp.]